MKGDFLLEYAGNIVAADKVEDLEKLYNEKGQGSYLYIVGKFWWGYKVY